MLELQTQIKNLFVRNRVKNKWVLVTCPSRPQEKRMRLINRKSLLLF
jgi:hypothetical protein